MNPGTLWHAMRRVRWRTVIAIVSANIRLYGWVATSRKVRLRMRLFFDARYRKSTAGRVRETNEAVNSAAEVFSRPAVLIVGALDLPQCKKYRVSQKVEYFQSMGWDCYYTHYSDKYRAVSYLQIATALIFYRVPNCAEFNEYIQEAARLGIRTFYDIDDPIFNVAVYSENKNLEHIAPHERAHLIASAGDYLQAMKQVDALILSTAYLQELAHNDFESGTYLWRNLVDSATLSIVQNVRRGRNEGDLSKVIVGYASGSRAHDADFNVASHALASILEVYEHVELQVIGYAVMPPALDRFKGRINTRPFSGYAKYFEALSQIDINIVPLVDDRFNACKSAIRYLEASLCSVPTVASSVGQFSEIIIDGQDGYLAGTQDAWACALDQLINSCELRLKMGEAAYTKVMAHQTLSCPDVIDRELLKQFALTHE
jgi:glycosyltransferase involved in cell wall biosynthesis